jgi:hypothetical protein
VGHEADVDAVFVVASDVLTVHNRVRLGGNRVWSSSSLTFAPKQ